MAINLWKLWSDLSWKDAASSTKGVTWSSVNYLCHLMTWGRLGKKSRRKREHFHNLLHIWIKQFYYNCFFLFFAHLVIETHKFTKCENLRLNVFSVHKIVVNKNISTTVHYGSPNQWQLAFFVISLVQ